MQAPAEEVRSFTETGRYTSAVSTLYAMLRRMDCGVERVLDALAECGLAENTVVLFTSDNGPDVSGEGDDSKARFNCGFNGAKGNVLEGGIRLPMILRWPAEIAGNWQTHEMTHLCDWFPTLISLAGVRLLQDLRLDGYNLLPLLKGETHDLPTQRFWQWNRYQPVPAGNAAMRDGEWKLVRPIIPETINADSREIALDGEHRREPWKHFEPITGPCPQRDVPPPPPPQLFNITDDPEERHDLADRHPERVHRMQQRLDEWFTEVDAERRTITDSWGGHLYAGQDDIDFDRPNV